MEPSAAAETAARVVAVGRAAYPYLAVWIAVGATALLFLPPLVIRLARRRPARSDGAPTWLLAALGLGGPLLAAAIGLAAVHLDTADFDQVEVGPAGYVFAHSVSGDRVAVPRHEVGAVEIVLESEPAGTEDTRTGFVVLVHLADGRTLRSEDVAFRDRLVAALAEAGLRADETAASP